MIESWWHAHALELVLWAALVALLWFIWLGESICAAWRERKQKKRDGIL